MKKLRFTLAFLAALGLGLWAWSPGVDAQGIGSPTSIACNKSAYVAPATATTTAVVNAVAGQVITFCGWHVTSLINTDNSFSFVYGTQGGPCSSPVVMTGALHVINSAPSVDHNQYGILSTPLNTQLCVVTTAATALQIEVWYAQY